MNEKKQQARNIQIAISIMAAIVLVGHLVWPTISLDGVTLFLLAAIAVPWLLPLFKSIELPGGLKVEFQELEKAKDEAQRVGLLAPAAVTPNEPKYSFQLISRNDPNLALAGLRIEIEKRLVQLAESYGVNTNRRTGAGQLLTQLRETQGISIQEWGVLSDLIGTLNRAAHGAEVSPDAADWAMDVGPRILQSLDDKLKA